MHISFKPFYFIIVIVSFYVIHLPFTECTIAFEEVNKFGSHKSTRENKVSRINHQKTTDIALHGLLLWASMGFLMPLGILTIRGSCKAEPGSRRSRFLFYLHVVFQMLSVLLATVGAAISLKKGKKERSYWYFVHWILGTIVSLVGIINIFTGLEAFHRRTLKSTRFWTILFTAQVSIIGLIYLLQDKLEHLKKQGVIVGTESIVPSDQDNIPQRQDHQKELHLVACAKRNALGNLFD
ncbi:hypothetical protein Ahy_B03g062101 isoform B [Arachis hypogaea]|uniref:Cytochrome b561 domain-containing protein n=1 Tax=Arachis hypogaea TaxID=3818 RepID=A0A444ZT33_ARAHY|nr:hypothetical protein Ahy_B03g062101 isoform B [Arachis hypogaea]